MAFQTPSPWSGSHLSKLSQFRGPPLGQGAGNTFTDASLSLLAVRSERNGNKKTPGDGRVYHIAFTATDTSASANTCTGEVTVCVPHDQGNGNFCLDGGPLFSSIP